MILILLTAAAIAAWHLARHRRRTVRPGPGASAAARARALRTPAVRAATALGIPTQRAAQAYRYDAGAEGERRTAARIDVLRAEGWTILHDRALPYGRANVDHLAISPRGLVILPDTKLWSSRYRLRIVGGRLLHGGWDVTGRLRGLRHEAATVADALGTPVVPLVLMDGAPVEGGELHFDGIRIVPADQAVPVLRALARTSGPLTHAHLTRRAHQVLPPYQEGHRR
ncbi:nuclease-related domain-containing protein [Streptomyces sp. NPDC056987]|uniref:nuclease-related domain-containing protein n=1 Tax=Streptomyces sp. NPDC056987 TaxID=3345988 RepID=UPI00363E7634